MLYEMIEQRRLLSTVTFDNGFLTIIGTSGNDVIDVSRAGGGVTNIYLDNSYYGSVTGVTKVLVKAGGGDDVVRLTNNFAPNATLYGGAGNDTITGGFGNDVIYGEDGNDTLFGLRGRNSLIGGRGDDTFVVTTESFRDYIDGQSGNDLVDQSAYNRPTTGSLEITQLDRYGNTGWRGALASQNYHISLRNVEALEGGTAHDTLTINVTSPFNQTPNSLKEIRPTLLGAPGDDILTVRSDGAGVRVRAVVEGGANNDKITVHGPTLASLFGQAGNDRIDITNGSASFADGGDDDDVLYGSDEDDVLRGGSGRDALFGQGGQDSLFGDDGNDYIEGGTGDDSLYGGEGDDQLLGQQDGDRLDGGNGFDKLDGGSDGDDFFAKDGYPDTILGGSGFDRAQRDDAEAILDSIEHRFN